MLKCCDECCDENRFEYGFECGFECVFNCVYTQSEECCVRAVGNQLSVDNCDCKRMRVQIAHASVALNKGKCKCRQRQFHHAVDANHAVELWKTTNSCNGCRQGETGRVVAIGEMRFENQGLGSKRDSA